SHNQLGHAPGERLLAVLGDAPSLIGRRELLEGPPKELPRLGELASVLFAIGEVELRPDGGVESLALAKPHARRLVIARVGRLATFLEERLGGGRVTPLRVGAKGRKQEEDKRNCKVFFHYYCTL